MFLGEPWPGRGQPLWTDEDRAWALALRKAELEEKRAHDDECPGCGQSRTLTFDPQYAERWTVEELTDGCAGCYVLRHKQGEKEAARKLLRVKLRDPADESDDLPDPYDEE